MLRNPRLIAGTAALLTLTACAEATDPEYDKTRAGAATGAAVGVLSQIIAGNSPESALKAAAAGAIVGAVIGNILDKQEADLRRRMEGSGANIINTGEELIVSLPEAITFDTDSTHVRSGLQDDLGELSLSLLEFPDTTVDVIGHTDSVGDAQYNQNLSARRAKSVNDILLFNDVPGSRLRAFGRGEVEPIATNDTAEGRAQNRRVEIVIRPVG